ncbi:MAG: 23S rRNA (uracil(1939)-C(5))-methyltransferase RlmD [Flavobacteriales bacterium]
MSRKRIDQVRIEDVGAKGKAIARVNEKVLFVRQALPGDLVDVKLTKKKKNYDEGVPIRFHEHSPHKQKAFCKHFDLCGGCTWQELPYEDQLHYKENEVRDQFERIGKVDTSGMESILPAPSTTYYRNKLEFSCADKRWLTEEEIASGEDVQRREGIGLHIPGRFDRIVDIEHCHLQPDPSNKARNEARRIAFEQGLSFYDPIDHGGFFRNLLVRTSSTGASMLVPVFAYDDPTSIQKFMEALRISCPEVDSWHYFLNPKKNDSLLDLEPIHYGGDAAIEERIDGLRFRIGPKSFFQTNSGQAVSLYRKVEEFAALKGSEELFDLYCGTGTIALYLASKAKQVTGIESVQEAIDDAEKNAALNGIRNVRFQVGDMKEKIKETGKPDVLITDPPRAGMHKDVVQAILDRAPERIIYVSCAPSTQARDIELMSKSYRPTRIQPVDMFPHTYHVENVVRLDKKL